MAIHAQRELASRAEGNPVPLPRNTFCRGYSLFLVLFRTRHSSTCVPLIQLRDTRQNFSVPLHLARFVRGLPPRRWIQVHIPLRQFVTGSVHAFNSQRVESIFFVQSASDPTPRAMILDQVKIDFAAIASSKRIPPPAPRGLRATGYELHVDLEWEAVKSEDVQHYTIYRSFDGINFQPIGIQAPGITRFADFLGRQNEKAYYKVAALGRNYESSS